MLFIVLLTSLTAEVVEISEPGVLDRPGVTYLLTQDVRVDRTAFMIKGDGITLDLGGHTVTYGTAVGVDRCSGVFLRPGGGEGEFAGVPKNGFGGGNRFTLKNGRIVQGKQPLATKLTMRSGRIIKAEGPVPGQSCFAVYVRGCDGLEISNITTEVNSRDTDNIYIRDCSNVNVHHNHCISSVREITDRHWPGTGVITVAGVNGPMKIHHNTVDGGGQWGIRVAGGGFTGHLVEVNHNIIRHRTWTTNGYGLGLHAPNMRVHSNVVRPVAGRGVHLVGAGIDFYNNIVDVKEIPNPEYPRTRAHGIKLEGCSHTLVHHNFSRGFASKGFGDASPLDLSVDSNSANRVFKNTVVAERAPDAGEFWAASMNLYHTAPGSLTTIHDNIFRTNHQHVRTDWGGCREVLLRSNVFEVLGKPAADYVFWHFWQSTAARTHDIAVEDPELRAGAEIRRARILYAKTPLSGVDVSVRRTVKILARNPAGLGVGGLEVLARRNEKVVGAGVTDNEGRARIVIEEFRLVGDQKVPVREAGPITMEISREGQVTRSEVLESVLSQEWLVTVKDPKKPVYVWAGADQRVKIGETVTLSGKVVTTDGLKPTVLWKQVAGPQKLTIKDPKTTTTTVTVPAFGGYTFELSAWSGDEVITDKMSVRADDKLVPTAIAKSTPQTAVNTIVQLDASASRDPRRFPKNEIRYLWKQTAGPKVELSSPEWPTPIFYPVKRGRYEFEVTIANPLGESIPAKCAVQVK